MRSSAARASSTVVRASITAELFTAIGAAAEGAKAAEVDSTRELARVLDEHRGD